MIVVTGATGFVGQAVRERLNEAGHDVLALTHGESFQPGHGEVSLDLNDPRHYEPLRNYCEAAGTLIHLAGLIPVALGPGTDGDHRPRAMAQDFSGVYQSNVVMTARLLGFALSVGIRHVVFASSQSVYGLPSATVVTEDTPPAPLEHYAASKVACETTLALWARGHGRKATILRFPGVWGEGRRDGVVHALCRAAIGNGRLRVGAGYPLPFDVVHRADVAAAFVAALDRPGDGCRVYNVATGELCSLTRLAQDVAEIVPGCRVETFGVAQPDIALDAARAATELGWRARPRRERLAEYIGHLRQRDFHA